jgi:hypothetical protein
MAAPPGDEALGALDALVEVLRESRERVEVVDRRVQGLRDGRRRGASYAELLTGADGPLVLDVLAEFSTG